MGTVRGRGLDRIDRATMDGAVADRSWRASTPEAIDADLAALWRDVGRGETSVARAVMSNLIVFRSPTSAAGGDMAALVGHHRVDLADLNWRRLAPLRRALTHARGQLKSDAWRGVDVRVSHAADEAALAWLFFGWLRSDGVGCADPAPMAEAAATAARDREGGALLAIEIGDMHATLSLRSADVVCPDAPPLGVAAAAESEADAVAAELRSLAPDRTLAAALEAIVERFER